MAASEKTSTTRQTFEEMLPRLLEHHGDRLYGLALRLCGNSHDAEDMLQETFLQAQRKWHTFRGESDPATWLYAIAARMCKGRMRAKYGSDRRMPALSQVAPWSESTNTRAGLRVDSPATMAERKESEVALRTAIMTIPDPFRVPLILKDIIEMPLREVGLALNIKPETVKTRVHRARLLLRKAMLDALPQAPAPSPIYEKQVCMDLLRAKLAAMDEDRVFPIGQDVICRRCQAVFRELDLVQETCAQLSMGRMPRRVKDLISESTRSGSGLQGRQRRQRGRTGNLARGSRLKSKA